MLMIVNKEKYEALQKENQSNIKTIEMLKEGILAYKFNCEKDVFVYDVLETIHSVRKIVFYKVINGIFKEIESINYSKETIEELKGSKFISKLDYILKYSR